MPVVSFSGLASGIDGDSIIKALVDARRKAEVPLKDKLTANDSESKAFEDLNTKLLSLNDTVAKFLTLSGGGVSKTASSSNEDAVSAVVDSSVAVSGLTVNVSQLARAATLSFDDRFATRDTALFPNLSQPSTIQFSLGTGESQQTFDVPVTNTTTLEELAASISAAAPGKLQASVANAGTAANPQYLLMVNGAQMGTAAGTVAISVPEELTSGGLFSKYQLQQAQDAKLTVSGIGEITRASNTINDVVPGLSLNLKQAGTGSTTIAINTDATSTSDKVAAFVGALNELIKYSRDNSSITQQSSDDKKETINSYGTLARSQLDEQAVTALRQAISGASSGTGVSEIRIFADLGVTTEKDGTYKFDPAKFSEAVAKNPAAVNEILRRAGDAIGATGGVINQYTKFDGYIDQATSGNQSESDSMNDSLARMEASITAEETRLRQTFTNLEKTISDLNSKSSALLSLLVPISNNKSR